MKYLILLLSFSVQAEVLTWTIPTQWEGDFPLELSDISGYKISCSDANYDLFLQQNASSNETSATLILREGKNYCNMVTLTTNGNTSAISTTQYYYVEPKTAKPPVIK